MRGRSRHSLPKHLGGTWEQLVHHPLGLCHPTIFQDPVLEGKEEGPSGSGFRDCSFWQGQRSFSAWPSISVLLWDSHSLVKNGELKAKPFTEHRRKDLFIQLGGFPSDGLTCALWSQILELSSVYSMTESTDLILIWCFSQTDKCQWPHFTDEEKKDENLESGSGCFPRNRNFSTCSERL